MEEIRGSISFIGLIIMLLSCLTFMGTIYIYQNTLNKIQLRSHKYLCLKLYLKSSQKYVSRISKLNLAIQAANTASLIPTTAAIAQQTLRTLKFSQSLIHLRYLSKLSTTHFCNKIEKATLLSNLPYQTKGVIKLLRSSLGTTKVRKPRWKINILAQSDYMLTADIKLKSTYASTLKIKTKEMPFLNRFYGSQ